MTEHHLEFLSLKGGCTGWSESTLVKSHIVGNHMSRVIFKEHLFNYWHIFKLIVCTHNAPTFITLNKMATRINLEIPLCDLLKYRPKLKII